MPIRLNPVHDLGPCILTLENIRGIVRLFEENFSDIHYVAFDNIWMIEETCAVTFFQNISQRETLDGLCIEVEEQKNTSIKKIKLSFNEKEASVNSTISPEHEKWFEHFMFELKKNISPRALQMRLIDSLFFSITSVALSQRDPFTPIQYCQIIIQKKQPSPFWENVKANIASNIIWLIIAIIVSLLIGALGLAPLLEQLGIR